MAFVITLLSTLTNATDLIVFLTRWKELESDEEILTNCIFFISLTLEYSALLSLFLSPITINFKPILIDGLVGALVILLGFWSIIAFYPICIIAGLWQICLGLYILKPFCRISWNNTNGKNSRSSVEVAILFLATLVPLGMCFSISTLCGSLSVLLWSLYNFIYVQLNWLSILTFWCHW